MLAGKLVCAAMVCGAVAAVACAEKDVQGDRVLATRPLYPYGRADDVHRPGFNGRLWIGRPIIGGVATDYPLGWSDPGPAAYGAGEYDFPLAYVKVNTETVGVTPWEGIYEGGLSTLEHGRQEWLEEQGYVGGVRTFINDAVLLGVMQQHAAKDIQPRATFEWPIDQPRFKHRQQVEHNEQGGTPAITLQAGDRVSWPKTAPGDVVARAEAKTSTGEVASTAK